ncbi:MAG: hypothetical protein ACPG7F_12975 [Aggregatilineales bacterium]
MMCLSHYATPQNNLGIAYMTLAVIENGRDNFTLAITAYEAALRYRTPDTIPRDYAQTQGNPGVAYYQQGNTDAACIAWQEALQIYQEQNYSGTG